MRVVFVLAFMLSFAAAHTGFNRLSWQETLGPYSLNVLEDFHVQEAKAQVLVQVSDLNKQAPENTTVTAKLRFENSMIYENTVPFIANGSSDGKTYYATYVLETAIKQAGMYELELLFSGPLGSANKTYFVVANNETRVPLIEYLPSALILIIVLGGVAILFMPLAKRKEAHESSFKSFTA